jgi:hypothetical protein
MTVHFASAARVLAAMLLAAGFAVTATNAQAAPAPADYDRQTATRGTPPSGDDCRPGFFSPYARTCYEWSGDDQWVRDDTDNGWRAVARAQTSYGKVRDCIAPVPGQGWGECTFDHDEDFCVRFLLYELRTSDGEERNPTVYSPWYRISNGLPC